MDNQKLTNTMTMLGEGAAACREIYKAYSAVDIIAQPECIRVAWVAGNKFDIFLKAKAEAASVAESLEGADND
jgi:hypothetical protein